MDEFSSFAKNRLVRNTKNYERYEIQKPTIKTFVLFRTLFVFRTHVFRTPVFRTLFPKIRQKKRNSDLRENDEL